MNMLSRFVALFCAMVLLCPEGRSQAAADVRSHSLKITVVDTATQQPVAGASVVSAGATDITPATSGPDGVAVLGVPVDERYSKQLSQFNVTVKAPGYAVRVLTWNASAGGVRETLPAECPVNLQRGTTVGGVVRDEHGQPVAAARIEFHGSDYKGVRLGGDTKSRQEYSVFSAFGPEAPVTDGNGVWRADGFPPDLGEVTITVIRPSGARAHFMAGSARNLAWQRGQRVDLAALKSGDAKLALKEGFTVAGRVVDETGRPLAGVKLRARDAASRNRAHEFVTDLEGRFALLNWDAAKVIVSAEHDGYQGTTVKILTGADAGVAKIVLRPGQPLRLRVIDEKGAPIPGAEIRTDPNPAEQIVSWKAQTDAEGRVVWPAAPDAPVKYWINAKGMGVREARLLADGSEHVIRFRPGSDRSIEVKLRVVDAASGAPIPDFVVWRRIQDPTNFKPWGEGNRAGEFSGEFRRDEFMKGMVEGYRLEVHAPGYGVWGTDTLNFAEGDQTVSVKLVKGGGPNVPPPRRQVGSGQDADSSPALLALATQVVRLLESGDVAAFTQAVCATEAEWRALVPEGVTSSDSLLGKNPSTVLERRAKAVAASAERLLALARQAGFGPGTMRFEVKAVNAPGNGGQIYRLGVQTLEVPLLRDIRIMLEGEPAGRAVDRERFRGTYQVNVGTAHQLPAGWRCEQGIRWVAWPAGAGDDAIRHDLRLVNRVAVEGSGFTRFLTGADDAALNAFGEAVAGLLRTRDVPAFIAATGPAGLGGSAKDLPKQEEALATSIGELLALSERLGIDFAPATIRVKQVTAGVVTGRDFGSIESLSAASLNVEFDVEGGGTPQGRSIAGRYGVSVGSALRRNGQWRLASREIRWQGLPEGLISAAEKKTLALENYVAENGELPPGAPAPGIEFVKLADGTKTTLAAYRDRVVVLEFWASWCGPCQEPMEKLQWLMESNPRWKNRVEVIALSIDDNAAKATEHLEKKGWTRTLNGWAGNGGFKSAPATAFRVRGIPASYVIGRDGVIVGSGHPGSMDFGELIEKALPAPVTGSGPESAAPASAPSR